MREYRWYGHYNADDSYTITEIATPRHWYNYLFNDEYISFISQVGYGEGLAQDDMGRRVVLLSNRALYLVVDGGFHSLFGLPVSEEREEYFCTHARGFSTTGLKKNGISSRVRVFVPNRGRREIWSVTLTNETAEEKRVKLIAFARTELDGVYRPQAYNIGVGGYLAERRAVYGRDHRALGAQNSRPVYCFMASSEVPTSFDARLNAFIGPYGDLQHPAALEGAGGCTGSDCNSEKLCLALENGLALAPGQSRTVHYTLGVALSEEEIEPFSAEKTETEFALMREKYARELDNVHIETPWEPFDRLINGWLPYATDMGSRWARVRHNGYRDMTSDTECLAAVNPFLAWERLKRILTYQYQSGYAPRTFIDGQICDNRFADNTVWLTFAAHTLIRELGDPELLIREKAKFNDTEEEYTVYEHLRRSVDFLYHFQGLYGLVRIWGGDWNDCINHAGLEGKGVSVWLSIAWCRANQMLAELARLVGREEDARLADERGRIMRDRIEAHGWDEKGGYYIYARCDDDTCLGAADCEEGQVFLNPQLWAVLAGLPRAEEAMERAEELLETPLGIRLSYPAYSHHYDSLGTIGDKFPGVQDNGGIYLHPSAWKLAVDSRMRRPDRVEEGLRKILPFDSTYAVKGGEPYAMYNCYFPPETGYRNGTPGQSWRTGSGPWLLKSVIEYVFGLYAEIEGLRIAPCLPLSWKESRITKRFRGCTYDVSFHGNGEGSDVLRLSVNGEECSSRVLPPVEGQTLTVEVWLGKAPRAKSACGAE